jgi:hypothetical protein
MFTSGDRFRQKGGWGDFRIERGKRLPATTLLVALLIYMVLALAAGVTGAAVVFGFMEGLVYIRNWYYYDVYRDPSDRMLGELAIGFVSGLVFALSVIACNWIDNWSRETKHDKRVPELDLDEEELDRRVQTEILDKENQKERQHE